jgi:hypothetical protein
VTVAPRLLASPHWDFSTSVYWAVTAHNLDTGESLDGPVWHFTTLPASTPIDSLVLPVLHWSTVRRIPSGPTCNSSQLALGPDIHSVCRWGTEDVDPNLKLAGVALRFVTGSIPSPGSRGVAIWATTSDWPICQIVLGGPPFADEEVGQLAAAEITFVNNVPAFFRLNSDALTSHVEAGIRHHRLYGYEFRAQLATNLTAPSSNGTNSFTVYYYRLPEPAARLSHAPTIANRRGAAPRATAQRGGSR